MPSLALKVEDTLEESEFEFRPGMDHLAQQIVKAMAHLGSGLPNLVFTVVGRDAGAAASRRACLCGSAI